MRKRDRLTNVVWLRSLEYVGSNGGSPCPPEPLLEIHQSLHLLCGQAGYLVQVEMDQQAHLVRLYPVPGRRLQAGPQMAISYCGKDLRTILATAWRHVQLLPSDQVVWAVGPKETPQWVP